MKECDHLFVYGTLQGGFSLHGHLRKGLARFLGKGRINARLFDLGKYPGAIPSRNPQETVEGELYELGDTASQLKRLDTIEEFDPENPQDSLFVRKLTTVRMNTGRKCRAWVYFLPKAPKNGKHIPEGNYAAA